MPIKILELTIKIMPSHPQIFHTLFGDEVVHYSLLVDTVVPFFFMNGRDEKDDEDKTLWMFLWHFFCSFHSAWPFSLANSFQSNAISYSKSETRSSRFLVIKCTLPASEWRKSCFCFCNFSFCLASINFLCEFSIQ